MIPVTRPCLSEQDASAVHNQISTGWISSEGPCVREFETNFASYIGMEDGVSVTNGTTALDVVLKAIDLPPGSEIVVPAMNIASCLNGIIQNGYKPVFVDCDIIDYNSHLESYVEKVNSKTGAIIATHIYGLAGDMKKLQEYCESRNVVLIEDTAQAIGLKISGQNAGSFGRFSTFSFYPNKMITTGEGGMVLVKRQQDAKMLRKIRNLSFDESRRFYHDDFSTNSRLTNIQAALGCSQLKRIDQFILHRKLLGSIYRDSLSRFLDLQLPIERNAFSENCYWAYPVVIWNSDLREIVLSALRENQIGFRTFFYPLNLQPGLKKYNHEVVDNCENAERLYKSGFYLPMGNGIEKAEVNQVCEIVAETIEKWK